MSGAPRALITGVTGQDGAYLADLLLTLKCHLDLTQPAVSQERTP